MLAGIRFHKYFALHLKNKFFSIKLSIVFLFSFRNIPTYRFGRDRRQEAEYKSEESRRRWEPEKGLIKIYFWNKLLLIFFLLNKMILQLFVFSKNIFY